MKKLLDLYRKHKDVFVYLFFGALTTLVNYLVYLPLYNYFKWSATASNVAAWVIAVLFAFFTNKPFVFGSHDWSRTVVIPELGKFVGCRIGSGLLETLIVFLTIDILGLNGNIMKVVVSIVVVIINYFGSKFLVFGKNNQNPPQSSME